MQWGCRVKSDTTNLGTYVLTSRFREARESERAISGSKYYIRQRTVGTETKIDGSTYGLSLNQN